MPIVGINIHKYQEAVDTHQTFVKTGETSFLWGMFKFPAGYYHEEIKHLHVCKRCGEKEFARIHNYLSVNTSGIKKK